MGGVIGPARCPCAQVCDRVRELLLCEESENAELYSDDEKDELLWRIFGHLVLGGACNQYEVSCTCTHGARRSVGRRPP